MSPSRAYKPARIAVAVLSVAVTTFALSGCNALDSFTGSQSMRWVGDDVLPKSPVTVKEYKAVPLLPDLTAPKAMTAFGEKAPKSSTKEQAAGADWSVTVQQSEFATTLRYSTTCKDTKVDREAAIAGGNEALVALDLDPEDWSWFVLVDKEGSARAIGEPNLEGQQTWASGSFAVLVDEDGACAASGTLMGFEATGGATQLDSAYQTFQDARHSEGLAIEGEYREYQQTWTLKSQGLLVPLWRFTAEDHAIVAVDLGDGLETALDSESALSQGMKETDAPK